MKITSAARTISAIALIAIVQNLQTFSGVLAVLCTAVANANEYSAIKTQIAACEAKTSVTMELPLAVKKTQTICASCPELAAQANAQTLPDCKIVQTSDSRSFKLQKQFERLFMPCITIATSDSGSDGNAATTTTAPATTAAMPIVTPVTLNPATTTAPVATTTPKPVASKPQTTTTITPSESPAVEDNSSTDEEDEGSDLEEGGTVKPSTGATTSKSSKKSSGNTDWDNASGSSSNNNNETAQQSANSSPGSPVTVEFAAAVAGGLIAVVLVSAIIVVAWRHHHHRDSEPDKRGSSLSLNPSTSGSQQLPFQFSISTASTGRAQKWTNNNHTLGTNTSATMSSTMRNVNLWEDEVIVAARIPKDKVMVATLLSRGGFGEVYRGMYNHQPVAIKRLLPETRKDLKEINAFLSEVKLMATLEHERIVQFIGVAWDSLNDICVVSEYMESGDLKGVLGIFEEQQRPYGFDHTKVKIALHIAHALTYMHSLQPVVLHRDLKSKNILLDTELRAKLTDFGVSRERSDTTMTAAVGTSLWMAPEVMMGDRYGDKADVFSFGIVLSELDTHVIPYGTVKESGSGRRIPDSAVLQMIALGRLKVKFSPNAHPEIVKLGNACVSLDPKERPSASEALYQLHTMLKGMYMVI